MTKNQKLGSTLFAAHDQFKEQTLWERRFKHKDISPLITKLQTSSDAKVTVLGKSVEMRNIYEVNIGTGKRNIMLWSQMHGDEPTSTMAIFDMIRFLESEEDTFKEIRETVLTQLNLSFIPMLNPDGVERFQRRNAAEVDLNRDAVAMACPESRILKAAHEKNKPIFGFNLHDQSKYYNVLGTRNTATHSFLAPAYNYAKDVNETRKAAMQGIALMDEILEELLPNHTGRYNDDFEPRAFGDNIQLWGTSTILVEAGGLRNDPEKQEIRRMHFAILLSLLYNIATDEVKDYSTDKYWAIPENDHKLQDLIIRNVHMPILDTKVDIGINQIETELVAGGFNLHGEIEDLGDLSTYFGYEEFDAAGLEYLASSSLEVADYVAVSALDFNAHLAEGIGIVKLVDYIPTPEFSRIPMLLVDAKEDTDNSIKPGNKCGFFLRDTKGIKFAVINGKVIEI